MRGKAEFFLVWVLRIHGGAAVCAIFAVFMPASMMVRVHGELLGLGDMRMTPVVEYLARALSAFYFLFGCLHLLAAVDVRGRAYLVRFIAVATIIVGGLLAGAAVCAGLPWWWAAGEGVMTVAMGAVMLALYVAAGLGRQAAEG